MPVSRQDVIDLLATCPSGELRLLLEACDLPARDDDAPRALAERAATALWWHWTTPLGYALDRTTLDDIVTGVARRLRVKAAAGAGDPWARLDVLSAALLDRVGDGGPVAFDALPADAQARARGSIFPTLAWSAGSAGSYGIGAGARVVVTFANGPIGRWIPLIPNVGPWFVALRKASGVAAVVGTPLAIAFGVLAVNQALGRRWARVLPLLLSIGALQAHRRVAVAVEVPAPV